MRMFTHEHYVEFRIPKAETESWSRLTLKPDKLHWLQTDWSRVTFEDSEPEDDPESREAATREEQDDQLKKLMKELYKDKENEIETMKENLEENNNQDLPYMFQFPALVFVLIHSCHNSSYAIRTQIGG